MKRSWILIIKDSTVAITINALGGALGTAIVAVAVSGFIYFGVVRSDQQQSAPAAPSAQPTIAETAVSPQIEPTVPVGVAPPQAVVVPAAISAPEETRQAGEAPAEAPYAATVSEPAAARPALPPPAIKPAVLSDPKLADSLCAKKALSVSFEQRPNDNRRYQALNGSVVLTVADCDVASGAFTIESIGTYSPIYDKGVAGRNSLSLRFQYYVLQRTIHCTVSASSVETLRFYGTIYCDGSNDEMDSRQAIIDI